MNLNKVTIAGRLTHDPEVKYTPKGTATADIGLAVNRKWRDESGQAKEETTFIDVTLWGKTAENAGKYLQKGSGVFIEGRLQTDTWEDKATGHKRSKLKVIADSMQFFSNGTTREPARQTGGYMPPNPPNPQTSDDGFDDIPF